MQLVPCAVLAFIAYPITRHSYINRVLWAFCVYTEAVSVAPQVLMMQHNKTIEKFTGHYVFFLGVSRFFSCAHWILQMVDGRSTALWTVRCSCTRVDAVQVCCTALFFARQHTCGVGVCDLRLPFTSHREMASRGIIALCVLRLSVPLCCHTA